MDKKTMIEEHIELCERAHLKHLELKEAASNVFMNTPRVRAEYKELTRQVSELTDRLFNPQEATP